MDQLFLLLRVFRRGGSHRNRGKPIVANRPVQPGSPRRAVANQDERSLRTNYIRLRVGTCVPSSCGEDETPLVVIVLTDDCEDEADSRSSNRKHGSVERLSEIDRVGSVVRVQPLAPYRRPQKMVSSLSTLMLGMSFEWVSRVPYQP